MAVAKARKLRAIPRRTSEVDHRALVIGGGLAGMTAALSIAEQGFGVTLVEREEELGGNLRHIYTALPNLESQIGEASPVSEAAPSLSEGSEAAPSLSEGSEAAPSLSEGSEAAPSHSEGSEAAPSHSEGSEAAPSLSEGSEAAMWEGMAEHTPQALLGRTIEAVSAHPRISVLTGAEIVDVGGYVGQYRTTVKLGDERGTGRLDEIQHGAIVVATGARQIEPRQYLYGQHPRVITQRELEALLAASKDHDRKDNPQSPASNLQPPTSNLQSPTSNLQSVVMIQCVGSRDEEHPYCSRICCTEAIKNALAIKERSPDTQVYILYRDIRTFGFKERYYQEARRKGVIFLQYDREQKPEVRGDRSGRYDRGRLEDGRLRVDVTVQPEEELFTLDADLVVLSAGIEPRDDNDPLAKLLKVPLDEDGFFLEAHVKLRPLDFAADGVYLCGMAHSPRFLDETIAQARGAAMRAVTLLSKKELEATPIVASVDPLLCSNCGQCIEVCPYDARVMVPFPSIPLPLPVQGGGRSEYVQVIDVLCQGCGACVVACPNKASQQKGFELEQVYGMLDAVAVSDER
jgi:heterodisulfide reductase subunit A